MEAKDLKLPYEVTNPETGEKQVLERQMYNIKDFVPGALKVLALMADSTGCAWYRCRQPAHSINNHYSNIANQVVTNFIFDPDILQYNADYPKWDIIVSERQHNANNLKLLNIARLNHNTTQIYESDDDLFHIDPTSPAASYYNNTRLQEVTQYLVQMDHIIVSTTALGEVYKNINQNITVIPNAIEFDFIEGNGRTLQRYETPSDEIVIGWSGSATHMQDLKIIEPVITDILKKYPKVKFQLGGWDAWPLFQDIPKAQLIIAPWCSVVPDYYKTLQSIDIGICAITPTIFNNSKSNIKYLEYSAHGVPTIASNFGPYADSIKHGSNGMLVATSGSIYKRWFKAIEELIHNAKLRRALGMAAFQLVKTKYNQKDTAAKWVETYKKAYDKTHG